MYVRVVCVYMCAWVCACVCECVHECSMCIEDRGQPIEVSTLLALYGVRFGGGLYPLGLSAGPCPTLMPVVSNGHRARALFPPVQLPL